jgi:hypothetical protein
MAGLTGRSSTRRMCSRILARCGDIPAPGPVRSCQRSLSGSSCPLRPSFSLRSGASAARSVNPDRRPRLGRSGRLPRDPSDREIKPQGDERQRGREAGMTPQQRRRRARIAAHASWASTADRATRAAAGTKAFLGPVRASGRPGRRTAGGGAGGDGPARPDRIHSASGRTLRSHTMTEPNHRSLDCV